MKGPRYAFALFLALVAGAAQAHRASDGFLTLRIEDARIRGQYELALRDVAALAPVDADGDRSLTWGELRRGQAAVAGALGATLQIEGDGGVCALAVGEMLIHDRSDGRYAWLDLDATCPRPIAQLRIRYRVLFDLDPSHRGLMALQAGGLTHTAVFEPSRDTVSIRLTEATPLRQFVDYFREGAHHIWIGADHILFLLALLLPCVLHRSAGAWLPVPRLRQAGWEVFRVVSAFTIAHSVTLSLSALDVVRLPGGPTETVIALSVLLAALNNLRPVVVGARWQVALGFGLIHGFGFASVLGDMGLPDGARALALLAFNLGIEAGQLAIVAAAVPAAFALRGLRVYVPLMRVGSLGIVACALAWIAHRSGVLVA